MHYSSQLRQDFSEYTTQYSLNDEFSTLAGGNIPFPSPVRVLSTVPSNYFQKFFNFLTYPELINTLLNTKGGPI